MADIDAIAQAALRLRPDILVLCHGGPIALPEQAQAVLRACPDCHGFYGASSMERLPVELALTEAGPDIQEHELRLTDSNRREVRIEGGSIWPRSSGAPSSRRRSPPSGTACGTSTPCRPGTRPSPRARSRSGRASDSIGCVRSFSLQDGGRLREQLLAMSDPDHSVTYSILVSPMPVTNYVATLRLTPVTVGQQTFVEWWAEFDVTAGSTDAEMVATIGDGVFVGGFEALQRRFSA